MCIIIHKPLGASLPLSTVLRGYQRNDDGWGLVARTPTGLIIHRDFGNDADATLIDTFAAVQEYEVTLHCRIGTCGDRSIINTHPFNVTPDVWMFHNGTIDVDRASDKRYCDSYHFANRLRDVIGESDAHISAILRDPEYHKALETYAKTSKLVFIDNGGIVIVNEHLGFWRDGCWFSNESADQNYSPYAGRSAKANTSAFGSFEDWSDEIDDDAAHARYEHVIPRCYRVESPEDEDALYLDALRFLDDCKKLDVDDIAERCLDEPEIAAEAIANLLQERFTTANPLRLHERT